MSDPVKSSEIEDVLSSIRRLVSEETRSQTLRSQPEDTSSEPASHDGVRNERPDPEPDQGREAQAETAPSALVLTPALRVHEGGRDALPEPQVSEFDEERVAESEATSEVQDIVESAVKDAVAEVVVEEIEEHLSGEDGAPEDVPVEPAAENLDDIADLQEHPAEANAVPYQEEAHATGTEPITEDAERLKDVNTDDFPEIEELPDPAASQQSLESKIAALEALISNTDENWEPELGDAAPRESGVPPQSDMDALDWENSTPDDETEQVRDLEDRTAGTDDMSDPDPVVAQPPEKQTPASEEADGAEVTAAGAEDVTAPDPVQAMDEVDPAPQPVDISLDEETLRAMVIDIVREELQGALGERITRNVRRLVRREINRALAQQELP